MNECEGEQVRYSVGEQSSEWVSEWCEWAGGWLSERVSVGGQVAGWLGT